MATKRYKHYLVMPQWVEPKVKVADKEFWDSNPEKDFEDAECCEFCSEPQSSEFGCDGCGKSSAPSSY